MKIPSPYFDPSDFSEASDVEDTRPVTLKAKVSQGVTKLPFMQRVQRLLKRIGAYFSRLQWKLTFAYTLFTAGTILILAIVALALLWYLNFQSNLYPNAIAEDIEAWLALQ